MNKLICSAENCINNISRYCTTVSEIEKNDSHSKCKTFAAKIYRNYE